MAANAMNGLWPLLTHGEFRAGPAVETTTVGQAISAVKTLSAEVGQLQADMDAMGSGALPGWDIVTADSGDGTACILFDNSGRVMWLRNN